MLGKTLDDASIQATIPTLTTWLRLINNFVETNTAHNLRSQLHQFGVSETGVVISSVLKFVSQAFNLHKRQMPTLLKLVKCLPPLLSTLAFMVDIIPVTESFIGHNDDTYIALLTLNKTIAGLFTHQWKLKEDDHSGYLWGFAAEAKLQLKMITEIYCALTLPRASKVIFRPNEGDSAQQIQTLLHGVCVPAFRALMENTLAKPDQYLPGLRMLSECVRNCMVSLPTSQDCVVNPKWSVICLSSLRAEVKDVMDVLSESRSPIILKECDFVDIMGCVDPLTTWIMPTSQRGRTFEVFEMISPIFRKVHEYAQRFEYKSATGNKRSTIQEENEDSGASASASSGDGDATLLKARL